MPLRVRPLRLVAGDRVPADFQHLAVRQDAAFRTNLVLTNATQANLVVDVKLFSGDGVPLASGSYTLLDVHGAGTQRGDPKAGDPASWPQGFGPQGDVIRIFNHVRLVRDADADDAMPPLPFNEIRVVDDAGADVAPGVEGEILLRGPSVMDDYWRAPEVTEMALAGGWLHTRDVGWLDRRGRLVVVGRRGDMIITGGENVHPVGVEKVAGGVGRGVDQDGPGALRGELGAR